MTDCPTGNINPPAEPTSAVQHTPPVTAGAINVPPEKVAVASRLVASARQLKNAGLFMEARELLVRAIKANPLDQTAASLLTELKERPPGIYARLNRWATRAIPVAAKYFVAFVAVNILATWIGHFYWREQQIFQHQQTILDRKLAIATSLSEALTEYLQLTQQISSTQQAIAKLQSLTGMPSAKPGRSSINQQHRAMQGRLEQLRIRQAILDQRISGLFTQVNGYFGDRPAAFTIKWDKQQTSSPYDIEQLKGIGDNLLRAMLKEIISPPPPGSFWQALERMWRWKE